MSGGVDSSVAAARLVEAGLDVVGVTLHLWDYPDDGGVRGRCCAPEDVHDARRVADKLGVFHYAFDRRELFKTEVVDPFVDAYVSGETPSPCVRCNRGVKLRELEHLAGVLSAQRIATGHYARIGSTEDGAVALLRARDRSKDQSYFLHMLRPELLSKLCFPLGDSSKAEVRAEALKLGLPGASKGESQELCFVPSGRYTSFVEERAGARVRPGPIVGGDGRVLGEHSGLHGFTIGQRKNLGVAVGRRAYVVGMDPETASVKLGEREELLARGALIAEARLAPDVALPRECDVQVRYRAEPARALLVEREDMLEIAFTRPVIAVVPGQYAVFYEGERVLGGGVIRAALPVSERQAG